VKGSIWYAEITLTIVGILFALPLSAFDIASTKLEPHTTQAFDQYLKGREAEMNSRTSFLWCDGKQSCLTNLKQNDLLVDSRNAKGVQEIPGGLIHDWQGAIFVSGKKVDDVIAVLGDYNQYKAIYGPEVVDSRLLSRQGDRSEVYLRLRKKKVITVILNTQYDTVVERIDRSHGRLRSISTRVTEVEAAETKDERELPPGLDHGFMWRLNSYWRFEERDGGVYLECEAISLSRGVPALLSSLMAPILRQLPRESLEKTLLATRRALMHR